MDLYENLYGYQYKGWVSKNVNETVYLLPWLQPVQHKGKYVKHYLVLFTAAYKLYRNLSKMYGKRAARDNPETNHRIPIALEAWCAFKTKTFNFENLWHMSYRACLGHVKRVKAKGKSTILS